jgi:hypothetical protein
MIVSHSQKYIFVAIPKTATHSVRQALRPYLASSDWEQVEHLKSSRFPIDKFKKINHGHLSLQDIKPYIEEKNYREYLKFTFVRNPFERFVSYAFFRFKGNQLVKRQPTEAMKLLLQNPNHKKDILLKPQHEFICNSEGKLEADFIGKVDNLQVDCSQLAKRLELPELKLKTVNEIQHQSAVNYLDEELTQMIVEKYSLDFKLFDYALKPEKES